MCFLPYPILELLVIVAFNCNLVLLKHFDHVFKDPTNKREEESKKCKCLLAQKRKLWATNEKFESNC